MSAQYTPRLPWEAAFLDALAKSNIINHSARVAGISPGTVHALRKRNEAFGRECARILQRAGSAKTAPAPAQWQRVFLEALAETSNVTASAKRANVAINEVYRARRRNRKFAAQWQTALFEGYTNLEMELLGYLRDPKQERKMDVANALRLLAAHKETAAKEGAQRAHVSAAEVRASIERKVEVLRRQVAADKAREAK